MTTLETRDILVAPHRRPGFLLNLLAAFERSRHRRARHRTLLRFVTYDLHQLRDMGIDPEDVEDAVNQRSLSLLFNPIRPSNPR